MAVWKFQFLDKGFSYSDSTDLVAEHSIQGRAWNNSVLDDPKSIGSSILIPQLFSPHPWHGGARLKNRQIEKEHKFTWICTFEYSTEQEETPQKAENPNDDQPQVTISTVQGTKIIEKDLTGKMIANTLGLQPDKPVEIRRSTSVLRVVRNEIAMPDRFAWLDHVNEEPFAGGDPGTVYCSVCDAERGTRNGYVYWKVTYEFQHDPDGWQLSLLNQSLYKKDGTQIVRITDGNGVEITQPVPIDAAGAPIEPDDLPDDAHFLDFDVYEEADFNDLSLPV